MKKTIISMFAVAGIAVAFLPSPARTAPNPKSVKAASTSNVACYFRTDDGKVSWQWGLTGANSYFSFSGEWKTTPYTKNQKFHSATDYATICSACDYAKTYYKESGNVFAMFASVSNSGYNYPIVLGANEISPLY